MDERCNRALSKCGQERYVDMFVQSLRFSIMTMEMLNPDLLLLQEENWQAAQERLVALAKANSEAQACPYITSPCRVSFA